MGDILELKMKISLRNKLVEKKVYDQWLYNTQQFIEYYKKDSSLSAEDIINNIQNSIDANDIKGVIFRSFVWEDSKECDNFWKCVHDSI